MEHAKLTVVEARCFDVESDGDYDEYAFLDQYARHVRELEKSVKVRCEVTAFVCPECHEAFVCPDSEWTALVELGRHLEREHGRAIDQW